MAKKLAREKAKKEAEEEKAKERAEKRAAEKSAKEKVARAERAAKEKAEEEAKEKAEKAAAIRAAKARAEKEEADKLAAKKAEYHRKYKEAQEKKKAAASSAAAEAKKKAAAAAKSNNASNERAKQGALASWGSKVERHVKRRWHEPPGSSGSVAKVRITVSNSGYIVGGVKVLSCKGPPSFCASVKDAFTDAEPLPRTETKYRFKNSDRTFTMTLRSN